MDNNNMVTLRNKKTGETITVPREKFTTGVSGIASDIGDSLASAPEALGNLITSIPGGIKKAGRYALTTNPVSTLANLGAGAVEGGAGLISSPQVLMRYLAGKFPELGKRMDAAAMPGTKGVKDPTFYEALKTWEGQHGLAPQSEDEASVRNAGGLIFGGAALSKIPGAFAKGATLSAQQAGQGGDPVHAALMALIGSKTGEVLGKGINKAAGAGEVMPENMPPAGSPEMTANMAAPPSSPSGYQTIGNIPKAAYNIGKSIPEAIKGIPEMAGTAASTGLDTLAGLGSQARIPVLPSLTEALSDYIKYKSIKPETLAQRKLFSDIESKDLPMINERQAASQRLGLSYLTPAESTLSPFEAAKQGSFGRTSSGSKLLFQKGKERTSDEGTAIGNLLDTVYDAKELDPQKAAAYSETMKAQVPDDFINAQMQRPVIQKAVKTLEGNAAYRQQIEEELGIKLGDIKPNSFMYWDMVKRVLGDMGEKAKEQGRPTTESDILSKTRRTMVQQMDDIKPEYEVARGIAERRFTRKKLEDVFDKKSMTINNFKNILGSEKKFNDIINKLKAYPEAQQKLKDMKLLFGQSGDMIHNDMNIRSAAALKRTSMSEARNKVDAMKAILDEKYGKAHDVATVNLMTSPEWPKILAEHLKKKGK